MNKMIKRSIQNHIEKYMFQGKAIIIYGARQTGKTTLVSAIQKNMRILSSLIVTK